VAVANVVVAGEPVRTLNIQGAETASMVVTLGAGEQPISDLLIQTRRGNELRGRVLVDGAIPVTSAAERFMLTMNPQDAEHGGVMNAAVVATDGTFVMGGLTGRGRVLPSGAPSGASLLRVIANGLDVTDDGIDMDKGNVAGVEVHLTTRPTWVKGQLVDAEGKLIQGNIIAFSENPALWSKPNSRYVVRSSATNGIFQIVGLPAGRYLAVAVDQIGLTEWADPENLLRLRPQATPFTVVEGEAMTMSIRRR
jgi:hypothetical protein